MALEVFCNFGACLLSAPVSPLVKDGRVKGSWYRHGKYGGPGVYTLDEALQLVRFMRGELDIPTLFRGICGLSPDENSSALSGCFDTAEAVLVEINSPVGMLFGRFALSRAQVIGRILNRFKSTPEMAKASSAWYNQGMMGGNATVLEETALIMAQGMSDDMPDLDLARAVLLDSRPNHRDLEGLVEGLRQLRDAFKGPLGIVTYTHQYMPDGRPLPWPSDFVEQTIAAAERLDLPVFQPSLHVKSYGASRALMPDRVHYQGEFATALAEPLWEFLQHVAGRTTSALQSAPPKLASA